MSTGTGPAVAVVDYGRGNLLSVARALESVGGTVSTIDTPDDIARADRLVLPGVGAFGDAMDALTASGMAAALREFAASGRPFLGICLGMQLMFDSSDEFGRHRGLGLIAGAVRAIPRQDVAGRTLRTPHVGWNALETAPPDRLSGTVLAGIPSGAAAYFVHSFAAEPDAPTVRLADCLYGGRHLCAAVGQGSLYGCQFHPEKSGACGLRILANFLRCR